MPDTHDVPRLLVVTCGNFNLFTGTGISNTNLFRGWPTDRIANLHYDTAEPDTSVCERFYSLSERELRWMFPFGPLFSLARWLFPVPRNPVGEARPGSPVGSPPKRLAKSLFRALGGYEMRENVVLSSDLCAWLDDFAPDILYTTLGDLIFLRLSRLVADRFGIPSVVHIVDDWPDASYRTGLFASFFRRQMERELRAALERASLRFTICDTMSRAYLERYGMAFRSLISPVDSARWLQHTTTDWSVSGPFRVVYMGTVHPLCQTTSMVEIGHAVDELSAEGRAVRFDIFTPAVFVPELSERFREIRAVRILETPPSTEAPAVLAGADMLVIPVNFDEQSARYNKYSMPAKTLAYMISGTPTLVYGPAQVPPAEYALAHGWGPVVSVRGIAHVKEGIARLMDDEALRKEYGTRGRDLAVRNHDSLVVRERLQGDMIESVRSWEGRLSSGDD